MASSTLITDYMQYGTLASRPVTPNTPTNCSPLYYATDTSSLYIWDGAWVQVTGAGAGGGLYAPVLSAVPTSANTGLTSWVNQGSASVTDTTTGVLLAATTNGSAQSIHVRSKASSGAHTYTALIAFNYNWTNVDVYGGISWSDGTKFQAFSIAANSSGQTTLYVINMANSTTQTAVPFSSGSHQNVPTLLWLQTQVDSTKVYYRVSLDGINFTEVYSVVFASSYLGVQGNYTNIGIQINPYDSNGTVTLMSWTQI